MTRVRGGYHKGLVTNYGDGGRGGGGLQNGRLGGGGGSM